MSSSSIQLPPDAVAALARGRMIEAVKIVRAATGLGLKEAKDAVDAYAAAQRSGASPGLPGNGAPGKFVFPQAAADAIARGELVAAIALLREANPALGLAAAKEAVDRIRAGGAPPPAAAASRKMPMHSQRVPTVVAGDSGSHGWLLLVLAVALVALGWWLFGSA